MSTFSQNARAATRELNRLYAAKLASLNNKPMVTGYKQVGPIKQNTVASKPIIAAPKQIKQTKPNTVANKPIIAAPKPRKTVESKPITASTKQTKPKNNIYSKKETLEYIKDPSKINKNNVGKLVRSVIHWNENKHLNISKIQYQSYTSPDAGSYDIDDLLKLSQTQLYNQYNKLRGIYYFNKKLSEQQIIDAYNKNSSDEDLAEKYAFIKNGFNKQTPFETITQLTSEAQDLAKEPTSKLMYENTDNINELRDELVRDRLASLYKNLKLNNDDTEKQFSIFKKSYETFKESHRNVTFESFNESIKLIRTIKDALGVDDIAGLSNFGYGSEQFLEGGRLHNLGDYITLDELTEIVNHYKEYRNIAETREAGSSVGINEYLIDVFDEISKHSSTKSLGLVKTKQDRNTRHEFIKAMYNSGKYNTEAVSDPRTRKFTLQELTANLVNRQLRKEQ